MSDRPFNILVINWQDITNPMGGGAEVHCHEIFKRVVAAGHDVTLLCCGYDGAPSSQVLDGVRIERRSSRNWFNFSVPGAYKNLRKQQSFDIVFDDINKIPFFTLLYVREPVVAIVHHFFGKSIFLEAPWLQANYVYQTEKLVPRIYRRVPFAVVSESTREELRRKGVTSEIDMLPNAVDVSRYTTAARKSSIPLIGYFGRVKKYKSVNHVIEAMPMMVRAIPDVRLLVIGDGDHRQELQRLTEQLGLSKYVEFTGHVSHDKKIELLSQLWLAVNPSPKEGWGLTVIEANACHVPVVAANSPGLRDSVKQNETGILYEYGNRGQLANAVIALLKNRQKRNQLSENARHWAESFNWDDSAAKALAIIEKTLKNRIEEI